MVSDQEKQILTPGNHHRRQRSSMSQRPIPSSRRVSLAHSRYQHQHQRTLTHSHSRSISSLRSYASIDYPAPAVAKGHQGQGQVNTLELELDSWTLQQHGGSESNCSIPYSVTIERHDDTGAPILGVMDFGERIKDVAVGGAMTDVPYEEMRAKGMRYCEVVSRPDGSEFSC